MAQERVEAPMTGTIISVSVKEGDTVNEDDGICVLEAMKMENEIVAPVAGKVIQVAVTPRQKVSGGDLIAVIES